jgi:hypothetical protein
MTLQAAGFKDRLNVFRKRDGWLCRSDGYRNCDEPKQELGTHLVF